MRGFFFFFLFVEIKRRNFKTFIDSFRFRNIFLLWIAIIVMFALTFHLFSGGNNFLYYDSVDKRVTGFPNALYFSFITASTTGYGDIVPFGIFKTVSVIEVLIGLIMIALVTSKIISIKQDIILTEIYDISFKEGISRLRSSLFRFKHNVEAITEKTQDNSIKKHDLDQLYIYLYNFEDSLQEILMLHKRSTKYYFLKKVETLSKEVILNAIITSFESLEEMLVELNKAKKKWKTDLNIRLLKSCLEIGDNIFHSFLHTRGLDKETCKTMEKQVYDTLENIKKQTGIQ